MNCMSGIAVATYLRTLRDAAGLSQEEAAVKAGISAKTLGRWEKGTGEHEPTVTNLKKLVRVLGGSLGHWPEHILDQSNLCNQGACEG